jgi:deazaflavin-dependent oxidoreductase (nitroreductase family)
MIPPRWLYETGWAFHRALFATTGGRLGAGAARGDRLGTLFLVTIGRRTGDERRTGVNYLEDGRNLAVVASNAGAPRDPAWWLNLQARPDAEVQLGPTRRPIRARLASDEERQRLWPRFVRATAMYDAYRETAGREIPVVILEPR